MRTDADFAHILFRHVQWNHMRFGWRLSSQWIYEWGACTRRDVASMPNFHLDGETRENTKLNFHATRCECMEKMVALLLFWCAKKIDMWWKIATRYWRWCSHTSHLPTTSILAHFLLSSACGLALPIWLIFEFCLFMNRHQRLLWPKVSLPNICRGETKPKSEVSFMFGGTDGIPKYYFYRIVFCKNNVDVSSEIIPPINLDIKHSIVLNHLCLRPIPRTLHHPNCIVWDSRFCIGMIPDHHRIS